MAISNCSFSPLLKIPSEFSVCCIFVKFVLTHCWQAGATTHSPKVVPNSGKNGIETKSIRPFIGAKNEQ